ncbi:Retrovirus-related Pol polyprotein from transposon 17.6 [Vitis vinifera]|uniref:Retrovirus-related Pol polyprotein from transposon 17.6 n=1 Tax=Vitis vinifera TaxID=29760 RepID=A0A438BQD0_VITVI|nr:Retrovirus-related Pol polyprotein from transposon 17.6 [Vitis vinifera]
MEDKKKEISEKKGDDDLTMNANPEKEFLKEEMLKKSTSPPFPQALHGKKGIRNASEILEVLRQVKVNIPLLDMIKQVLTYAKFLKDLCTIKRGLIVNKKAFLTEQVSAILQCKSPLKYKDPGSPTISVMIGGKVVEKALLDLGASVNLLPYSVYKQLDLQTTPEEEEGPEEVCIIDIIVKEHCNQNMQDKLNESLADFEEGLYEPPNVLATLQSWRRIEEILPLFNKEEGAIAEKETPKLNLKPLPVELKYTYLEENNQCPVVISSSLTSHQEKCLLEVLKRSKPIRQFQRRLNPHLQEVVQVEVLKLLQAGIIYPIFDSPWVSPTQVVPKKSGITMVQNEKGEEITTRLTSDSLAIRSIFSWTGIQGIFKLKLMWKDQEKTTFTCPFGTYAYRRMPFGLCNAPATFQRCMLSIFSDMVERIIEVFMDDITVYGGTFEECLVIWKRFFTDALKKTWYSIGRNAILWYVKELSLAISSPKKALKLIKQRWSLLSNCHPHNCKGVRQFLAMQASIGGAVFGQREDGKPLCDLLCKQNIERNSNELHNYRERIVSCDQIIRKCVPGDEQLGILNHCHENACGGHFASQKTTMKVLQSGFTWPSLFKMPTSCVEVVIDAKAWKANKKKSNAYEPHSNTKYGVKYKVATPYHPQTSGQVELANREIKNILMKVVNASRKDCLVGNQEVEYGLDQSEAKRCLDLNEMEELRNDAYINSKVAKHRMKKWHDQLISNKEFQKGQRVLLYDTRLHIFPRKLKSRWIDPFIIHQVHINGVVELLNSNARTPLESMDIVSSHSWSHSNLKRRKSTS